MDQYRSSPEDNQPLPISREYTVEQQEIRITRAITESDKLPPDFVQNQIINIYDRVYPGERFNDPVSALNRVARNVVVNILPYIPHLTFEIGKFKNRNTVVSDTNYRASLLPEQNLEGINLHNPQRGKYLVGNDPLKVLHIEQCMNEWLIATVDHYEIDDRYVALLSSLTLLELIIINDAVIPDNLRQGQSQSSLALLFTLLTGIVIGKNLDPLMIDLNRYSMLTNKYKPVDIRRLAYARTMILRAAVPDYNDNVVNAYTIALPADIDYFYTSAWDCINYDTRRISMGGPLPEDYQKLADEMGIDVTMYEREDLRRVLANEWYLAAPYYYYRKAGKLDARPKLPYIFPPIWPPEQFSEWLTVCMYSDKEIVDMFLPHRLEVSDPIIFYDRRQLREDIINDYASDLSNFVWILSEKRIAGCENDANDNPIMQAPRGEVRKDMSDADIIEDPILYYGPSIDGSKRRCFHVYELETSFTESGHGAAFLDPDWRAPPPGQEETSVIDPITGKPVERYFTDKSIERLMSTLKHNIRNRHVNPVPPASKEAYTALLKKIQDLFRLRNNAELTLKNQRELFLSKPEWRNDLLTYFSWLFLFGMWIRFWKGPGTPYPVIWREVSEEDPEYKVRDENMVIELDVRSSFVEALEKGNSELLNYIRSLPYYYRDWRTALITLPTPAAAIELLRTNLIEGVLDFVQLSDFCMAQASDLICGSAITYLTKALDVPEDRMNDLLVFTMGKLHDREKAAIDLMIKRIETRPEGPARDYALVAIAEHKKILNVGQPDFVQPPLELAKITATNHLPEALDEVFGIVDEDQRLEGFPDEEPLMDDEQLRALLTARRAELRELQENEAPENEMAAMRVEIERVERLIVEAEEREFLAEIPNMNRQQVIIELAENEELLKELFAAFGRGEPIDRAENLRLNERITRLHAQLGAEGQWEYAIFTGRRRLEQIDEFIRAGGNPADVEGEQRRIRGDIAVARRHLQNLRAPAIEEEMRALDVATRARAAGMTQQQLVTEILDVERQITDMYQRLENGEDVGDDETRLNVILTGLQSGFNEEGHLMWDEATAHRLIREGNERIARGEALGELEVTEGRSLLADVQRRRGNFRTQEMLVADLLWLNNQLAEIQRRINAGEQLEDDKERLSDQIIATQNQLNDVGWIDYDEANARIMIMNAEDNIRDGVNVQDAELRRIEGMRTLADVERRRAQMLQNAIPQPTRQLIQKNEDPFYTRQRLRQEVQTMTQDEIIRRIRAQHALIQRVAPPGEDVQPEQYILFQELGILASALTPANRILLNDILQGYNLDLEEDDIPGLDIGDLQLANLSQNDLVQRILLNKEQLKRLEREAGRDVSQDIFETTNMITRYEQQLDDEGRALLIYERAVADLASVRGMIIQNGNVLTEALAAGLYTSASALFTAVMTLRQANIRKKVERGIPTAEDIAHDNAMRNVGNADAQTLAQLYRSVQTKMNTLPDGSTDKKLAIGDLKVIFSLMEVKYGPEGLNLIR